MGRPRGMTSRPAVALRISTKATSKASRPVRTPKSPPILPQLQLPIVQPKSPAARRKKVIQSRRKMLQTALFDRKVTIQRRKVKTPHIRSVTATAEAGGALSQPAPMVHRRKANHHQKRP